MSDHIEGLVLSAYTDGAATLAERGRVEDHLPGCARCREELSALQGVKAQLARAPRKTLPPSVAAAWASRVRPAWWRRAARAVAPPRRWVPVGALAAGALSLSLWLGRGEEEVALEPLLAAHARCNAEALVPQNDLFNANFSARLAVYHPDEN